MQALLARVLGTQKRRAIRDYNVGQAHFLFPGLGEYRGADGGWVTSSSNFRCGLVS